MIRAFRIFATAGVLPVVLMFFSSLATAGNSAALFPSELGNMGLESLVQGEEALSKIDELHGKAIHADFGAVAVYAGGNERAEVWVSGAGDTERAAEQVRVMVEKMLASPRSPFRGHALVTRTNPKGRMSSPVSMHRFSGMGQLHYIFNTNDLVWWISCTPNIHPALWNRFLFNDY